MHCVLPTASGVRVGRRGTPSRLCPPRPLTHGWADAPHFAHIRLALAPTCLTSRSAQTLSLESETNSDIRVSKVRQSLASKPANSSIG
jgi:hypothetical protein